MQWVSHYGNIGDTRSSILWYIPWQEWTRFSTSRFNYNIYSTPADCCTHPNARTLLENSQSHNKMIHFPTPNTSRKHINRPSSVAGAKYPKLYNVSHTGLVPIFSQIDLDGIILGQCQILIFGRLAAFCDWCASELNEPTAPPLHSHIRATFQAVDSCLSSINSTSSSYFFTIVAVMEVERMADDMPKIEFCEFQEYEPQNNASSAKLHIRRSDTEVGMTAEHHLGGLRLDKVAMRWEWERLADLVRNDVSREKLRSPITEGRCFFCYQNVRERRRRVGVTCN